MRGILILTIIVLVTMIVIRDADLIGKAGLFGKCEVVQSPVGAIVEWRVCEPGRLSGRPDLIKDNCASIRVVGEREYWSCPATIPT